jgi:hypothetical protein
MRDPLTTGRHQGTPPPALAPAPYLAVGSRRSTSPVMGHFTPARSVAAVRTATRSSGASAVRSRTPESADTGAARSDGRGIDLLDQKGVVMIISEPRRSATHGPRLPVGTVGPDGRGGDRRGAG